jgi:D-arabinose 1-dehydrogenase-like Zn-dependent alcohol dehydrogenase
MGNPAAPRGGYSSYVGIAAAGAGHWNFALPSGLTSADVALMTCSLSAGASGSNTSELRPRPLTFLPLILR